MNRKINPIAGPAWSSEATWRIRSMISAWLVLLAFTPLSWAWDYEGHRVVNQLALASLPTNFPAFVRTPQAQERLAFLAGEPDRWRNTQEFPFRHAANPEHYFDIEDLDLYRLSAKNLPHFRYEFVQLLAVARHLAATNFPPIDPARDQERIKWLPGFLPWAIAENYAKLKSAFSYLKTFEENGGTEEEIENARQNVIYGMGVMGHFAGDAAQPLHTTRNYNGWVDDNPNGYSTNKTFHTWIDGGFLQRAGMPMPEIMGRVRPAQLLWPGEEKIRRPDMFPEAIAFILEQFKLVEPLYQLEKQKKLDSRNPSPEGKEFLARQLVKAGQFLGDMWFSAWEQAPPDTFLQAQLARRKARRN